MNKRHAVASAVMLLGYQSTIGLSEISKRVMQPHLGEGRASISKTDSFSCHARSWDMVSNKYLRTSSFLLKSQELMRPDISRRQNHHECHIDLYHGTLQYGFSALPNNESSLNKSSLHQCRGITA